MSTNKETSTKQAATNSSDRISDSSQLLYYSDNAIASSSEDDLSPFSSNNSQIQQQRPGVNHIDRFVLNEDCFKKSSIHHNANDDQVNPKDTTIIPEFNKRPLSDTPITSNNSSPNLSNVNSNTASNENSPEFKALIPDEDDITPLKLNKRRGTAIDLPGVTKQLQSPQRPSIPNQGGAHMGSKLIVVMVGLPASGKSYISNKLTRYMNWLQHSTRIFNVGETRRKDDKSAGPSSKPLSDHHNMTTSHDANFFNPNNQSANEIRDRWAMETLDTLIDYLRQDKGSVGVFDATNSTRSRRKRILDRIRSQSTEVKVLFLESKCSDKVLVAKNVRLKLTGPDYREMDPELALRDFQQRLANYEKAYQSIEDDEGLQYVKMIDVGKKVVAYDIQGFLASQIVFYLLNFNLNERQIWITRHGESEDNVAGKIGGDSKLTPRGEKFSLALHKFIDFQKEKFWKDQLVKFNQQLVNGEIDKIPQEPRFNVWTSMLKRAISTASQFSDCDDQRYDVKEIRMLNELCAGDYEGLTYEQIQERYPDQFTLRLKDKLHYRYPGIGGESYLDVLNRIRPVINEVERTIDHVLLITHRVVARVLLGYFMNLHRDHIVNLDIPLHCVYLLEPNPYGVEWTMFEYDESKNWFYKVDKEDMHKKRVKESGLSFRERKYSVVPTAPPPRFSMVRSRSSALGLQEMGFMVNTNGPLDSIQRARVPPQLPKNNSSGTTATISNNNVNIANLADKLSNLKR